MSSKQLLSTDRHETPGILGNLFQCLAISMVKRCFPNNPPPAQLCAISTLPSVISSQEQSLAPTSVSLLRALQRAARLLLGLLFSRWSSLSVLSTFSQDIPSSQSCYQLGCPFLDFFKDLSILFKLWKPEKHTIFKVRLHQH